MHYLMMKLSELDENFFFKWILCSLWIITLWEMYLRLRQFRVYKTVEVMPDSLIGIITQENFQKARIYALDKCVYALVDEIFELLMTTAVLWFYALPWFWGIAGQLLDQIGLIAKDHELIHNAAFAMVTGFFSSIIRLPFAIYYTFVLEERHGFNKQTAWFFIKDQIKNLILSQVITAILVICITYIVQISGNYLFIYLFCFSTAFTFFMIMIYPDLIAPLFDKYTPLPEGTLRTEIEKLAASIEFPLYKLYIVEGSKRSSHSNAYFFGLFKFKRIVLFDTLLKNDQGKGCENNEILAVLGHELGHWKLNHVTKNLMLSLLNMLFIFIVFQLLINHSPLYQAIGFQDPAPTIVRLITVFQFIFLPYLTINSFCMAIISRRFEFDADKFAKKLGRSASLKAALIKLNSDNLGFPIYDPWYSAWQNSHPPLLERLDALNKSD